MRAVSRRFLFTPLFFLALSSPISWAGTLNQPSQVVREIGTETGGPGELAYVLGPENLIQIKIFGDASVNALYRIDELGFINHALAGRLKLAGLTVVQAEELLKSKLSGDYYLNPQVNVFVIEHSRFSILGEVRKPGTYEILGRVSIIEAISIAGGFTPVANMRGVKIQRKSSAGGMSTINIDTTRITERGDPEAQVYIEADDVIVAPKSFF